MSAYQSTQSQRDLILFLSWYGARLPIHRQVHTYANGPVSRVYAYPYSLLQMGGKKKKNFESSEDHFLPVDFNVYFGSTNA